MIFRRGAIGLTAALLMAACGTPSATPPGDNPIALLAQTMQNAGGARMAMEMSLSNMGEDVNATMDGEVDFATGDASITMRFSSPTSPGVLEYRMLIVDRVMYLQPPGMEETSGKWMKVDLNGMPGMSPMGMDPQGYVDFLEGASDEFETVGEEEVRGVPTTHYRVEIDVDKLMEAFSGGSGLSGADLETLRSQLGDAVPVGVWIDGEGVLRRETVSITLGETGPMEISLEIFDYGIDVNVQAPDPDEVLEDAGSFGTSNESSGSMTYPAPTP
jgi:hypothetical protein